MFDNDINDLYQELILDHNAHPHNYGELKGANYQAHGHNPLCGDDVEIYLLIKNDCIVDICFIGHGCAISKSSASIMTDELKGKSLTEAQAIFHVFHELLTVEDSSKLDKNVLGKASVFLGVKQFPMRVKCATLAWHTLIAALNGKNNLVTTE
jgi:nitrogen fixation protein NifU and related proteins